MSTSRAATPARRPGVHRPHPGGAGAIAALTLALGLVLLTAGPALAHGPIGIIQPQPPQVDGPLKVTFRLRLIYANDTEPVTSGATVTVQGAGPGSIGPAPMTYEGKDGYYRATVTFPAGGTWRMTYTAANPAAQHVFDQPVTAPPTTPPPTAPPPTAPPPPAPTAPPVTAPGPAPAVTPAPTTTTTAASGEVTTTSAPADSTTTTTELAATGTTAPSDRSAATTPTTGELATSALTDQPSGGGGPLWALVAGGVVVAGGIAAAVVFLTGRRTPPAG